MQPGSAGAPRWTLNTCPVMSSSIEDHDARGIGEVTGFASGRELII
jgi:hypothetical protein